jgi:hypothetical protein
MIERKGKTLRKYALNLGDTILGDSAGLPLPPCPRYLNRNTLRDVAALIFPLGRDCTFGTLLCTFGTLLGKVCRSKLQRSSHTTPPNARIPSLTRNVFRVGIATQLFHKRKLKLNNCESRSCLLTVVRTFRDGRFAAKKPMFRNTPFSVGSNPRRCGTRDYTTRSCTAPLTLVPTATRR